MSKDCIFCNEVRGNAIMENAMAYVVYDKFPQTKGHVLIIPKRHSENFFETMLPEQLAMYKLVHQAKEYLDEKYAPEGYNILLNCGKVAGQIVMHTHLHLIPRYADDGVGNHFTNKKQFKEGQ